MNESILISVFIDACLISLDICSTNSKYGAIIKDKGNYILSLTIIFGVPLYNILIIKGNKYKTFLILLIQYKKGLFLI